MSKDSIIQSLYDSIGMHKPDPETAKVVVNHNEIVGTHLVPGLEVDANELADGIEAQVVVKGGVRINKPIHMCFGMLPKSGEQRIVLNVKMEENASASLLAHCTFPNAIDVIHRMEADIEVADGAEYSYFERHIHGSEGGVLVVPNARVKVGQDARFKTEFELLKGYVGKIDINYETYVGARSVCELVARISGRGNDQININESAYLEGESARGVLTSYIAVRDQARAEVKNTLVADAPYARGHVDCKEIVQNEGSARAVPIVDVKHPKAHVTHEASIGSVDSKQLQTLMSRGLSEDEAVELIIQGLLS